MSTYCQLGRVGRHNCGHPILQPDNFWKTKIWSKIICLWALVQNQLDIKFSYTSTFVATFQTLAYFINCDRMTFLKIFLTIYVSYDSSFSFQFCLKSIWGSNSIKEPCKYYWAVDLSKKNKTENIFSPMLLEKQIWI